jgi:hypothetical protein
MKSKFAFCWIQFVFWGDQFVFYTKGKFAFFKTQISKGKFAFLSQIRQIQFAF